LVRLLPHGRARRGPAFPAIGCDPTSTPTKLHAWLANPHPPMPNQMLSRQQGDDIIAYILSYKPK
jgi:hypothetical protein